MIDAYMEVTDRDTNKKVASLFYFIVGMRQFLRFKTKSEIL